VANIEAGHVVVEVNVVDPIRRKGYRFKGPAEVHRDGELYHAGAEFFQRRSGLDERVAALCDGRSWTRTRDFSFRRPDLARCPCKWMEKAGFIR
jgi:hypothetical protein